MKVVDLRIALEGYPDDMTVLLHHAQEDGLDGQHTDYTPLETLKVGQLTLCENGDFTPAYGKATMEALPNLVQREGLQDMLVLGTSDYLGIVKEELTAENQDG